MGKKWPPIEERFWKKVEKTVNCWNWTGTICPTTGYGIISRNNKQEGAHRISWEINKGIIEEGMDICHSCDVRNCVNPEHLFMGTRKENALDMCKKNRGGKKLNVEQVREVRSLYSKFPQRYLAKMFSVSQRTISEIGKRRTWQYA